VIQVALDHPRVACGLVVVAAGVLGYFGLATGRMSSHQPFPDGWRGALIGAGIAVLALAFAFAARRFSSAGRARGRRP
jgi:VIT1/CCC1 family predicted Fe2+/Mn2+ transporter